MGDQVGHRHRSQLCPRIPMADENQLAEWKEAFALFDKDKDGKIAGSELGLLMRSLGRAPTEQEVKDYTAEIAGSGSFDFEGLKGVMIKSAKPTLAKFQRRRSDTSS